MHIGMENNLQLRDRQLKEKGLTIKERVKIYRDERYKKGMDCLVAGLGSQFEADRFLDLYYIERINESRGRDYTKWHEENNPWEGMTIEEISREADLLWQKTHADKQVVETKTKVKATATAKMELEPAWL
jgi:hypothetical protein